jgi:hypothetical protein
VPRLKTTDKDCTFKLLIEHLRSLKTKFYNVEMDLFGHLKFLLTDYLSVENFSQQTRMLTYMTILKDKNRRFVYFLHL